MKICKKIEYIADSQRRFLEIKVKLEPEVLLFSNSSYNGIIQFY